MSDPVLCWGCRMRPTPGRMAGPWLVSPGRWVRPWEPRAALSSRVWWEGNESIWGSTQEKYFFPLYITLSSLTMFEKGISVPTAVLLQTEGPGWEQPVMCALLLKRKMCLDSLPNTTSASLCTSAGEAVQQGGEDGQTYQLTVWGPLSPLLPSSCRRCWKDDLPDVHLEHLWEMHSWDFPAVIEENHTLLAEKDWEKGRHTQWVIKYLFIIAFSLFHWCFSSFVMDPCWGMLMRPWNGFWVSCFSRCQNSMLQVKASLSWFIWSGLRILGLYLCCSIFNCWSQ